MDPANHKATLLVVDADLQARCAVVQALRSLELEVLQAASYSQACELLAARRPEYILTEIQLPDGDGYRLLDRAQDLGCASGLLVMTGDASLSTAIDALHHRVNDFLVKPIIEEDLRSALRRCPVPAREAVAPEATSAETLQGWRDRYAPHILGQDAGLCRVFEVIRRVCDTDCSVLITGPSGSGKELIARVLHDASDRSARPFVTVNCAAIPENLLESELFGHVRGAFTGAATTRVGCFVAADEGTLFLDEIGELPLNLQAKLLRAVQEKEVTPLGESRPRKVNVRVIAATHRDLDAMVDAGGFREDLLYRIQVVPIELPALKDRRSDIPCLVERFLERCNQRRGRFVEGVTAEALRALCHYDWPGNIRQLENTVERMVLLRGGGFIDMEDLPAKVRKASPAMPAPERAVLPEDGIDLRDAVEQFENALILQALERTGWNKNRAAAVLRMNRTTLVEKLKKKNLTAAVASTQPFA